MPDGIHRAEEVRSVNDVVRARKDEYIRKKTIRVKVGTWNVAAISNTHKDLGGWFAQGLGVKGLTQDLAGLKTEQDLSDGIDSEPDIETVEEQEARQKKKCSTLPKDDVPAVPGGEEIDLYVLGLQEVIDVSSMTEAVKPYTDPNPARRWKSALRKRLPRGYKKIVEQQLLGLLLLVFASPDLAPEISSVDSTGVGTGLMGYLGNKGAVSARLLLGEATRLTLVNCHLAAGADATALARRIWDTNQITLRTKFAPLGEEWVGDSGQSTAIGDEDIAFWFGDLNYRLDDIPGEDVRRLLLLHARNEYDVQNASKRRIDSELGHVPPTPGDEISNVRYELSETELPASVSSAEPTLDPENDPASLLTTLKSLLSHDQLRAQQRLKKAFHEGWREGDINFLPTYKYDIGSVAMFDSGEKKRSPSWCDRILYRTRLDYEEYNKRAKEEMEAKKKDEEMKKRGLDEAASQDDVLFDYDPDNDGGDDYDDDAEQHDNDGDVNLVRTKSCSEDAVMVEEYTSHQRVLSSDHKPLSAVFRVTYDFVDAGLRAKVFQQVTREFDKAENEARPNVTLVLDNASHLSPDADKSPDAPELRMIDFGEVRYGVQYEHHLTIANTGQIEVLYAFVDRPIESETGVLSSPFPSWLKVEIHQDMEKSKYGLKDLGSGTRFRLLPGETTNIDLLVDISQPEMVTRLNSGEMALDDILVLRISNGRDHFLPVKGSWQQTCFYRSIDELVRTPAGVRKLTVQTAPAEAHQRRLPGAVVHSAPQELFALTDAIPKLSERVVAEWEMRCEEEAPWKNGQPWPFVANTSTDADMDMRADRLAEIREALDTAETFEEHLNPCIEPSEKLDLLCETLVSFLASLRDGIITSSVWEPIEAKLQALEKSKSNVDTDAIQEIAMESISKTPVHSVSLTFITFMLNSVLNDMFAAAASPSRSPTVATGRSRSSTSASAMSDVSLSSVRSAGSAKRSFLSFGRRSTNLSSVSSIVSPVSPVDTNTTFPASEKAQISRCYAEIFAPLVIRSNEAKLRSKDRKSQLARKVKVLEAFLNSDP